MSRAQRLTFLAVAAVIAVVAVVLITRGDATTDTAKTPTVEPTATASQQEASPGDAGTPTPTPTATPKPVKTLKGGKLTKLEVTEGDTVRFKATADQPEEIHVHGYDLMKDIEAPGDTVSFAFKADITGVFEIEYENAGEQIGQLTVQPD